MSPSLHNLHQILRIFGPFPCFLLHLLLSYAASSGGTVFVRRNQTNIQYMTKIYLNLIKNGCYEISIFTEIRNDGRFFTTTFPQVLQDEGFCNPVSWSCFGFGSELHFRCSQAAPAILRILSRHALRCSQAFPPNMHKFSKNQIP